MPRVAPRAVRPLALPVALLCLAVAGAPCPAARAAEPDCLRGVNLSGPEFGTVPGRHATDYAYPSAQTIARFGALGLTGLRLPVRWERLQPQPGGPLDAAELLRLDAVVVAAKLAGMRTVIDLHNFAYYGTDRIGTGAATQAAFADVWRRLAAHFRSEPFVAFGLMNEPYDIPVADWLPAANAAVAAIRETGARQLVLVPGTIWTGAHSWESDTPLGNNARTMLGLVDPGENAAYDVHQYLDADFSGTSAACPRGADALGAVERLTLWLAQNRRRAYLGEIGASAQAGCPERMAAVLAHVNAHPEQWVGWAAWGAGDWWPPTYHFKVEPGAGPLSAVDQAAARAALRGAPVTGMDRLAILHVVRQFLPNRGGLEDFVANLAREQVRLGHDVRVLTLDRLFSEPGPSLPSQERIDGIAVERMPFRGSPRYPLAPGFLGRLTGADIVHVHAVDFFFDALALMWPLHRKPLVATTHGGFFHTQAHARLKRLWFNGPTRLSVRAYGAVVGCSDSDARQFAAIVPGGVPVIENGVDLAKFAGAAAPAPRRTLLTLGRFSHNKRLDRLIALMRVLLAEEPGWRLRIVGVPSDLTVADLEARIADAGLHGAVGVHAGLDAAGVRALIGESSLFVSASEYEGFGIALIEAMSAGLVPVVHPNASFTDLAARHAGIALCDFSDAAAAARAVREAYAALAARGRPPAEDLTRYAWEGVAARYLDTYAQVRRAA